jgi:hypothetical protein
MNLRAYAHRVLLRYAQSVTSLALPSSPPTTQLKPRVILMARFLRPKDLNFRVLFHANGQLDWFSCAAYTASSCTPLEA